MLHSKKGNSKGNITQLNVRFVNRNDFERGIFMAMAMKNLFFYYEITFKEAYKQVKKQIISLYLIH